MSSTRLRLVIWCCVLFGSCPLPVLPQNCSQFTITPSVGPGSPLIIRQGGSQTLTCSHMSIQSSAIDWYRDASVIRDTEDEMCSCQVISTSDSKTLVFSNIAPTSANMEYSCRAPLGGFKFDTCRFDVILAVAPSIVDPQPMETYMVPEMGSISIPLSVAGLPFPDITWRNGSTVLMNESRIIIDSTGGLTVSEVTFYDRGNYSLTLGNIANNNVVKKFSVFVPFIQIIGDPVVRVDGDQIRATCEAVGYPTAQVVWLDSMNNEINSGIETERTLNPFGDTATSTLTVNVAGCQSQTPYKCRARNSGQLERSKSMDICVVLPPQPMRVMVKQTGVSSVNVSWEIEGGTDMVQFEVCYTPNAGAEQCLPRLERDRRMAAVNGLEVGVPYTFVVTSHLGGNNVVGVTASITLIDCQDVSDPVTNVNVETVVSQGRRTFNISWRMAQESIVTGYKVSAPALGWEIDVNDRVTTSVITPLNNIDFCNGVRYRFIVHAVNTCGTRGPPSGEVVGVCATLSRTMITDVTLHGTAIVVKWELTGGYSLRSPLSITLLEVQLNSDGQQLKLNYSVTSTLEGTRCLGNLKQSTVYTVCLHPVYTDGTVEEEPVCTDVTTMTADPSDVGTCLKPESMTLVGSPIENAVLPDYAIAVIVVGGVIIIAFIFCFIVICYACSNSSKNKGMDDDMGSEYSSTYAGGMQGRMSNNHNRNMSPTRSCLSYHSKGHSTNWNDHMGTLREMETEVGTNV